MALTVDGLIRMALFAAVPVKPDAGYLGRVSMPENFPEGSLLLTS